MGAAAKGIELSSLEVLATSKSDIRGLLGMADAEGEPVPAGPRDVQLVVRDLLHIGVDPARLRSAGRRELLLLADLLRSAERGARGPQNRNRRLVMDALSETLRVVRLVGAIFIQARFTAPWCYQSPRADTAAPLLEPGAEKVVIFHLITEGECYVEMGREPPVHLVAGDVVIFPQGDTHRMRSQPGLPPAKGARLDEVLARRPRQIAYGGGGATTRLICGYLACDMRLARMLLAGLPPLVRVNVRGSNAGVWLEASVRYALAEARSPRPGGAGVLAKLAEVLFIEVLRLYMNEQSTGRTGWLAGVGDRIVGAALNALHARPAHAWTLEELAREPPTPRGRCSPSASSTWWEARRCNT